MGCEKNKLCISFLGCQNCQKFKNQLKRKCALVFIYDHIVLFFMQMKQEDTADLTSSSENEGSVQESDEDVEVKEKMVKIKQSKHSMYLIKTGDV